MDVRNEYSLAWDFINKTDANLFLTGKAGTGKTTFLKELKRKSPKRIVVLAPTGIAAVNAEGVTIHSFFQLPLTPYVPGASISGEGNKPFRFGKMKKMIIRTMDLLVIDEVSMVRADLLDAVDYVLRCYREHDKPFGGVQLLLIGDLQQLAPVAHADEWSMLGKYYDTPYFFSSKALMASDYYCVELKEVFRQHDDKFLSILNGIRNNNVSDDMLATLASRYMPGFVPPENSDYVRLTTHNRPAQLINEEQLSRLKGAKFSYTAVVKDDFPESSYPADMTLSLKVGAQIMFIKNDPEKRFYNGMIGRVVSLSDNAVVVCPNSGGEPFEVVPMEWTNSKYDIDEKSHEIVEKVEGTFTQYPLRLAWAITIHKSQGLTFEHAIIDVSHSFAHGQTYVALSRCKTLEGLVLSKPLTRSALICDHVLDEYNGSIVQRQPDDNVISALQTAFKVKVLDSLFSLTGLISDFSLVMRTINNHFFSRYAEVYEEYHDAVAQLTALHETSMKFAVQYRDIISGNSSASLEERVRSAAAYYLAHLEPFEALRKRTNIATDNKVYRKQLSDRLQQLQEDMSLKLSLLEYESRGDVSFSVSDYLRMKAVKLIDSAGGVKSKSSKKSRTRKTEAEKKVHIPSWQISYDMFRQGMDIEQIAEERKFSTTTVFSHLAECVKNGRLPLGRLVELSVINDIRECLSKHPDLHSLNEIKALLPPTVTYDEIRLVRDIATMSS